MAIIANKYYFLLYNYSAQYVSTTDQGIERIEARRSY